MSAQSACSVATHTGYPGAPPAFQVPTGGTETDSTVPGGTTCVIRRSDGAMYASAFQDAQGHVIEERYFDASGGLVTEISGGGWPSSSTSDGSAPDAHKAVDVSCGADDENPASAKWSSTVDWWLNYTIPSGLNVTNTITSLRNAHTEWTSNDTWCSGIGDSSSFSAAYQGRKDVSFGQDGITIIGWGDTSKVCSGAPAGCEETWYSNGAPVEGDIRFMASYTWSNIAQGSPGAFDVWYTAAHEVGHLAQFGHVSDSTQNVMDPAFTNDGDTSGRKLGKGDAKENNAKY
jgi:Matrixin